ncbi:retinaldehyde-binding protein 1 [Parasteatoda tepidariorum]|uniref:retinaldehyde-binding protein 1 n=1 Tax=Parasteatoda tepidariorum TaxID=114398 RepID=UPI0039BD5168
MENSYDSMMAAKGFLPYRMGYLTDWMVEKAKEELNETEEIREQALAELKRLIAEERNLDIWTDDSYLLQFLRARKFDTDRAMELVRNFYTMLKNYPDVYKRDQDPEELNILSESDCGGAYPYRHKDGGIVYFLNAAKWDPDEISTDLAMMGFTGVTLAIAEDPATQVCGVHFIFNAQYRLKHLRAIGVKTVKLISEIFRNTVPIRFKSIHIVNESSIFGYIFNMLKIFMTDKIRNRIHFHGSDLKELHKHIPKEILPAEFHGDNINYSAKEFCKNEIGSFLKKYCLMLNKGYF